ncbi:MAG: SsrA-binding protein SmpB [Patescibacteria group bacterium]|jgi:SsrA-binding protein
MSKIVAQNKKARFDYEILETTEGGLVLTGDEIKSIRAGRANLTGSYVKILGNEAWLINLNLTVAKNPTRSRKVLLHRTEINRFVGKTAEKGLTLVPLNLFIKHGYAKIEIGVGRGKKTHDKRESQKKSDIEREIKVELKSKTR